MLSVPMPHAIHKVSCKPSHRTPASEKPRAEMNELGEKDEGEGTCEVGGPNRGEEAPAGLHGAQR